jgi:hypothetical protein
MVSFFYSTKKIWDTIKDDLLKLVNNFQDNKLDLFRLNFATLTLYT